MPIWMGIDHRYFIFGAFGVSAAVTAYSTYKPRSERRKKEQNVYETEKLVNMYLVFHYGSPQEILPVVYDFRPKDSLHFPLRCAQLCLNYARKESLSARALDIGCGVGRSTFELTQRFQEVLGLDYSQSFVDVCNNLKRNGSRQYCVQDEGDLVTQLLAAVPEQLDRSKASFIQGDVCNLPRGLGKFDCVLAANVICRLHRPYDFLHRLPDLVAPGGVLVIISPYTWLEQFTKKSTWLGGYKDKDGKKVTGFDTLKKTLGTSFDLVEQVEMPYFMKETAREYMWGVAHATVWRRNIVIENIE